MICCLHGLVQHQIIFTLKILKSVLVYLPSTQTKAIYPPKARIPLIASSSLSMFLFSSASNVMNGDIHASAMLGECKKNHLRTSK